MKIVKTEVQKVTRNGIVGYVGLIEYKWRPLWLFSWTSYAYVADRDYGTIIIEGSPFGFGLATLYPSKAVAIAAIKRAIARNKAQKKNEILETETVEL